MIKPTKYTALILIRKPPFYKWLREANKKAMLTNDNFYEGDHGTYLIQNITTKTEFANFLKNQYLPLFENELNQWHERELWPAELSQNIFEQWFDVQINREVFMVEGSQCTKS
jgi:hypothetical protein